MDTDLIFTSQGGAACSGRSSGRPPDGPDAPSRWSSLRSSSARRTCCRTARASCSQKPHRLDGRHPLDKNRARPTAGCARGEAGGFVGDGAVSPDGRWLAYARSVSGSPHIFVSALSNPDAERTQVTTPTGGFQPRWARSGRELFYTGNDGTLMSVSVDLGSTFTLEGTPTRILDKSYFSGRARSRPGTYDVAPDGQRFLMLKPAATADGTEEPATVIVVKNWVEELKRLRASRAEPTPKCTAHVERTNQSRGHDCRRPSAIDLGRVNP